MKPIYYNPEIEKVEKLQRHLFMASQIIEAHLRDPRTHRAFATAPVRLAHGFRVAQARFKRNLRTTAALVQAAERSMKQ